MTAIVGWIAVRSRAISPRPLAPAWKRDEQGTEGQGAGAGPHPPGETQAAGPRDTQGFRDSCRIPHVHLPTANAECGVRSAELKWRFARRATLALTLRTPHSALRTLALTKRPALSPPPAHRTEPFPCR